MDSLFDIIMTVLNISLFCGAILLGIKVFKFRKKSDLKTEIENLQAKISLIRISMKSRVKKKSYTLRAQFARPINTADAADVALTEMIANKLETGADLQAYFDLSRKINLMIALQVNGYAPVEDFMSTDFLNEVAIIRAIKDISTMSAQINRKIDSYNLAHPTSKINPVDDLIFTSMSDVHRIFSDQQSITIDSDSAKPAA